MRRFFLDTDFPTGATFTPNLVHSQSIGRHQVRPMGALDSGSTQLIDSRNRLITLAIPLGARRQFGSYSAIRTCNLHTRRRQRRSDKGKPQLG